MTGAHPESTDRFRRELLSWGADHRRSYPWRDRDRSLYEVFVAEFLLTQTPADNVAEVYSEFLDRFPSLETIDETSPGRLEATIEPLGFQRMRTEALTTVAAEYDAVPNTRSDLLELPRVGPYVANATLCFARERPLPIVDRNVDRVYERVFGSAYPDDASDRRAFAAAILPEDGSDARQYNLTLLDFGALVCQKREPRCESCFASEYCRYYTSLDTGEETSDA